MMVPGSELLEKSIAHPYVARSVQLGDEQGVRTPSGRGAALPLMEHEAVAEQGVEEGIPRIFEADHVDLDSRGGAQVRRQLQQVEVLPEHGHVRIGAGARPAARAGAEEESQADVLTSAQRPSESFDDRV